MKVLLFAGSILFGIRLIQVIVEEEFWLEKKFFSTPLVSLILMTVWGISFVVPFGFRTEPNIPWMNIQQSLGVFAIIGYWVFVLVENQRKGKMGIIEIIYVLLSILTFGMLIGTWIPYNLPW